MFDNYNFRLQKKTFTNFGNVENVYVQNEINCVIHLNLTSSLS